MPTSLVTGGAGFLGSHVAKHLLDMGHKVIILDHLEGGDIANISPFVTASYDCWLKKTLWTDEANDGNCIFVKGSITSPETVDRLFEQWGFNYVFHLAAYAAESLSHHIRHFNYTNNLIGSVNLINAAVNAGTVKRFVFTSSVAVYGARAVSVASTTEETPPAPIDPYGIAKCAVEMDLKAAHEYFDLEYTIFRPHNVYGTGQNLNDGYRNVIGIFLRQALRSEPLTLFGTAHKTRQFSYIDDVAPYIARAAETPGTANKIFNIGSDPSCDIGDLAARVCHALAVPLRTAVWPERNEARHVAVNHDKFKAVFKPTPGILLDDGLARMAAWARAQPLREPKVFENIEVDKNLPEIWRTHVH